MTFLALGGLIVMTAVYLTWVVLAYRHNIPLKPVTLPWRPDRQLLYPTPRVVGPAPLTAEQVANYGRHAAAAEPDGTPVQLPEPEHATDKDEPQTWPVVETAGAAA